MRATILDVAKLANVSKATVSRVLNDNPKVNAEIRERVLEAIERLNYRPSAVARHLASSTSNMIGLILPDITNPYFPVLARGIEDAAHRIGCTLFISNTDNDPSLEQEYIRKMVQQQVAGIVLISSSLEEDKVNDLLQYDVPFVLCDRSMVGSPFDSVSIDNYKAAYDAMQYLIAQGHRSICHIAGPSLVESSEHRKQAYLDVMKEHDLKPFVRISSFNYESGHQQMSYVLNEYKPTAVFAANDLIALGAMNAIQQHGLNVPDDIAVIGCDDILFAHMAQPPLSTILVPAYQIGITAIELLEERMKGQRTEPKHVNIDYKLMLRESSMRGTK